MVAEILNFALMLDFVVQMVQRNQRCCLIIYFKIVLILIIARDQTCGWARLV